MSKWRRITTVLLGSASAVLGVAAIAWACTPQAYISVSPGSGGQGTQATVSGGSFTAAPVQIHWGSASGPVIGNAVGPRFSTSVTIPASAPDVYYIVAVGPQGSSSASFEVVGPAGPSGGDTTGGGGTTTGGGGSTHGGGSTSAGGGGSTHGGGSTSAGGGGSTSTGGGGSTSTGGGGSTSGGADSGSATTGGGSSSRARTHRQTNGGGRGRAPAKSALPSPGRSNAVAGHLARGTVTTGSGQRVFAGSLPVYAKHGSPSQARGGGVRARAMGSGFRVTDKSSLTMPHVPDASQAQGAGLGSRLAIGIAILGLGLVLLFGGFLVAVVRRRRAESEA